MKQPKLLFAFVFVFAAITAAVIWKERAWNRGYSPVLSTGSLGTSDGPVLIPSSSEEKMSYGPDLAPESIFSSSQRPTRRNKSIVVADAHPFSAGSPMVTASRESVPAEHASQVGISLGFDAGFDYFVPHVNFQRALSQYWVLGAQLSYLQNVVSGPRAEMLGGGVDLAYYWLGTPLRGGFVDLGVAAYRVTSTTAFRSSFATPLATSLSIGWSGALGDSLFLSLSAGGQYVYNFRRKIGDIQFDGIQPLVRTGLGINF